VRAYQIDLTIVMADHLSDVHPNRCILAIYISRHSKTQLRFIPIDAYLQYLSADTARHN